MKGHFFPQWLPSPTSLLQSGIPISHGSDRIETQTRWQIPHQKSTTAHHSGKGFLESGYLTRSVKLQVKIKPARISLLGESFVEGELRVIEAWSTIYALCCRSIDHWRLLSKSWKLYKQPNSGANRNEKWIFIYKAHLVSVYLYRNLSPWINILYMGANLNLQSGTLGTTARVKKSCSWIDQHSLMLRKVAPHPCFRVIGYHWIYPFADKATGSYCFLISQLCDFCHFAK